MTANYPRKNHIRLILCCSLLAFNSCQTDFSHLEKEEIFFQEYPFLISFTSGLPVNEYGFYVIEYEKEIQARIKLKHSHNTSFQAHICLLRQTSLGCPHVMKKSGCNISFALSDFFESGENAVGRYYISFSSSQYQGQALSSFYSERNLTIPLELASYNN